MNHDPEKQRVTMLVKRNKENIIGLYRSGLTGADVARRLRVSNSVIDSHLRQWNIPTHKQVKSKILVKFKNNIISDYVKGMTGKQVADKYGLGESTINLILKRWGVPAHQAQKAVPSKVKQLLDQGFTPIQIAEMLGVDSGSVYKVLVNKFGIHHHKSKPWTTAEDNYVKDQLALRISVPKVTKRFNEFFQKRTVVQVRNRMIKLGVKSEFKRGHTSIKRKHYSADELDYFTQKIIGWRQEGKSMDYMAKKLAVSTSLVQRIIKKEALPRVNSVFNDEIKEQIKEMFSQGLHYNIIAKKLSLKSDSVRQEVGRLGFDKFNSPFSRSYTRQQVNVQKKLIKKYYGPPFYFSLMHTGKLVDLDKTTVKIRLQKMGIRIRSKSETYGIRKPIMDLYRQGASIAKIRRGIKKFYGIEVDDAIIGELTENIHFLLKDSPAKKLEITNPDLPEKKIVNVMKHKGKGYGSLTAFKRDNEIINMIKHKLPVHRSKAFANFNDVYANLQNWESYHSILDWLASQGFVDIDSENIITDVKDREKV